jgi:hypothetical protein
MLATLAGFLALLLGMSLLLLPLLVTELSRPRESVWGAVVLLLGLVLVTSAERLTGSPMLAVLCGGLLMGRLGGEVAQGRWRALSDEERQALRSAERWSRSLNQFAAIVAGLLQSAVALASALASWLAERRQVRSHGKRWVRSDITAEAATPAPASEASVPAEVQAEPGPEGVADGVGSIEPPSPPDIPEAPAVMTVEGSTAASETAPPGDEAIEPAPASEGPGHEPPASNVTEDPGVRVVGDFDAIDALLAAAPEHASLQPTPEPRPEGAIPPPAPGPRG